MERRDIEFSSQGVCCRAWLYLPAGDSCAPVIVMAHGLGGTRVMRLDAFAERFCEAGYACLVFDYRHFGDSDGEPRQLLEVERQLDDWRSAVAWARACPLIDGARTVLWGTSFSGGHVITIAAEDPAVSAIIAQCPFTDGLASSLTVPFRTSLKLASLAFRDLRAARAGRSPVMVDVAGEPGTVALMSTDDAVAGCRTLLPDPDLPMTQVAARFALRIMSYRPGRDARRLRCPALFCLCTRDSVAPAEVAARYASRAPRGEVKTYDIGHFAIYTGSDFERAVADQIAFLGRHVPAR